jgi:hypothetical protein
MLSVCVPPPNDATQQLDKHIPAATNTHETVAEILNAMFSVPSLSYQMLIRYWKENKLLVPGGYKYGDLTLQVGGISNLWQ